MENSPALASKDKVISDLPVFELGPGKMGDALVIVLSGDGGWTGLVRRLGDALARDGASVVGFDLMQYLWTGGKPEDLARDLNRGITHYMSAWNKKKVLLVGYSLGADVIPFIANRVPQETKTEFSSFVLIG